MACFNFLVFIISCPNHTLVFQDDKLKQSMLVQYILLALKFLLVIFRDMKWYYPIYCLLSDDLSYKLQIAPCSVLLACVFDLFSLF